MFSEVWPEWFCNGIRAHPETTELEPPQAGARGVKMKSKKICVVGLGYIGLPTAAVLAENGYEVHGVEVNERVVEIINRGAIHIVEPELETYVAAAVQGGRLLASSKAALSDIYMICVPTPFRNISDRVPEPNIDYVIAATRSIAHLLKKGDLVILESTSPVGTTAIIRDVLQELGVNVTNLHFAYCPERVLPGKIMHELVHNDRIVGGLEPDDGPIAAEFYRSFVKGAVIETDAKTAEMCKLTENSFRDVNIAFANELSVICDRDGINVNQLIKLANRHPRVSILQPGTGVGGHCIAVDPWFIVAKHPEDARIIRTAREVNDRKPEWVAAKIADAAGMVNKLEDGPVTIACLGLAFKPDIDDMRESPAVLVVQTLIDRGHNIIVVEPNIEEIDFAEICTLQDAVKRADVMAVLVAHKEFCTEDVVQILRNKRAIDFCGALGL